MFLFPAQVDWVRTYYIRRIMDLIIFGADSFKWKIYSTIIINHPTLLIRNDFFFYYLWNYFAGFKAVPPKKAKVWSWKTVTKEIWTCCYVSIIK